MKQKCGIETDSNWRVHTELDPIPADATDRSQRDRQPPSGTRGRLNYLYRPLWRAASFQASLRYSIIIDYALLAGTRFDLFEHGRLVKLEPLSLQHLPRAPTSQFLPFGPLLAIDSAIAELRS